jgi:hypothetical protein
MLQSIKRVEASFLMIMTDLKVVKIIIFILLNVKNHLADLTILLCSDKITTRLFKYFGLNL